MKGCSTRVSVITGRLGLANLGDSLSAVIILVWDNDDALLLLNIFWGWLA